MPQRLGQDFRVFHRLNKIIETLGQAFVQGRQDTGSKIKEFENLGGCWAILSRTDERTWPRLFRNLRNLRSLVFDLVDRLYATKDFPRVSRTAHNDHHVGNQAGNLTRACPLPSAILGNLSQVCPGLASGLGQDFPEICKIFDL